MKKVNVFYERNIEEALKRYEQKGYSLYSMIKSSEIEMRLYLSDANGDNVCIARQFWDERYPESFQGSDLPDNVVEIHPKSEHEFREIYLVMKSLGMLTPVKDDDLGDVAAIPLNTPQPGLLVCPEGYIWE